MLLKMEITKLVDDLLGVTPDAQEQAVFILKRWIGRLVAIMQQRNVLLVRYERLLTEMMAFLEKDRLVRAHASDMAMFNHEFKNLIQERKDVEELIERFQKEDMNND